MQIAVSSAYRAQSDQNQWMVAQRIGSSKWESIAHFHTAGDLLLWLRTHEPGLTTQQLSDLSWVAAAESRLVVELGTYPHLQAITYNVLPRDWRHEIRGVAALSVDAFNVLVAPPWRARRPMGFPRLDQALLAAWLHRVRRDAAEGGKGCVQVMEDTAQVIFDSFDATALQAIKNGVGNAIPS